MFSDERGLPFGPERLNLSSLKGFVNRSHGRSGDQISAKDIYLHHVKLGLIVPHRRD
jgi:hypothetical protein